MRRRPSLGTSRRLAPSSCGAWGPWPGWKSPGAPFFVGEPAKNGWESPVTLGLTSARIEAFCDDPDDFIARAVQAGANGSLDKIRDNAMPWGPHRQGGFVDPFGHIWLVGDRSPLSPHHE